MPPRRLSREETKAATRRRLLRAADRVVSERGFDRASIEEIVREAGLTTGAVYSNFEGRDDLLAEVLAERQSRRSRPRHELEGRTTGERMRELGALVAAAEDSEDLSLVGSVDLLLFALRCPRARDLLAAKVRSDLTELERILAYDDESPPERATADTAVALAAYFLGLLQLRALLGRDEVHDDLFTTMAAAADLVGSSQ